MISWTPRLYQQGDEYLIKNLYENVFNIPKPLELWRWRYLDNPTGSVAILLATSNEDGSLVGQYTVCPIWMKIGNQDVIGALSLDTMVHPNFRGQKMFTKIAEELYQQIATNGIPIVYGFPNEQSHKGLTKYLGWYDLVKSIPIYVRPIKFYSLIKKFVRSEAIASLISSITKLGYHFLYGLRGKKYRHYSVATLPNFDEGVNWLWQQASPIAPILVRRDYSYLNWRYSSHPTNDYTIHAIKDGEHWLGFAVLHIQEFAGLRTGFIAELLVAPSAESAVDALLESIVKQAEVEDCDMVNCLMLEHISYVAALRRKGFVRTPAWAMPQELYFGARNNGSQYPDDFIHGPHNWYITWGDHDMI